MNTESKPEKEKATKDGSKEKPSSLKNEKVSKGPSFIKGRGVFGNIQVKTPKEVGVGVGRVFNQMFNQVRKAGPGDILLTANEKEMVRSIRQKQREVRGLYNARLHAQQSQYSTVFPLTIATATWNVAERTPADMTEDLSDLFHACATPDIVVISLQEVDMSPIAMTAGATDKTWAWEAYTTAQVFHCMPSVRFARVTAEALMGLMLIIFVQEKHMPHVVHKVVAKSTAGSVLAVVGNKGGIACRFSLYGKRFLFIGCHLPAHSEAVDKRNEAYHAMLADFRFKLIANADDLLDRGFSAGTCLVDVSSTIPLARWERHQASTVPDHDYIFWIGDLNYRVTISNEEARELLAKGDLIPLIESDQLLISRNKKEAFVGFEEGLLTFPPTYKFDPGTEQYDTSPKCRTPSWTDRILWACREDNPDFWAKVRAGLKVAALAADPFALPKPAPRPESISSLSSPRFTAQESSADGEEDLEQSTVIEEEDEFQGCIRLLGYQSHMQYQLSDHRPVSALFEVRAVQVDQDKFAELVAALKELVEPMESHIDSMIRALYPRGHGSQPPQ